MGNFLSTQEILCKQMRMIKLLTCQLYLDSNSMSLLSIRYPDEPDYVGGAVSADLARFSDSSSTSLWNIFRYNGTIEECRADAKYLNRQEFSDGWGAMIEQSFHPWLGLTWRPGTRARGTWWPPVRLTMGTSTPWPGNSGCKEQAPSRRKYSKCHQISPPAEKLKLKYILLLNCPAKVELILTIRTCNARIFAKKLPDLLQKWDCLKNWEQCKTCFQQTVLAWNLFSNAALQ